MSLSLTPHPFPPRPTPSSARPPITSATQITSAPQPKSQSSPGSTTSQTTTAASFIFDGDPFHQGLACEYSIRPLQRQHVAELEQAAAEVPEWSSIGRAMRTMATKVFTATSIKRMVAKDIYANQPRAAVSIEKPRPLMYETGAMVGEVYEPAMEASCLRRFFSYDLLNVPKPPLSCHLKPEVLWRLHHEACDDCKDRFPAAYASYAPLNASNPCAIKTILSWVVRGYMPPWRELPQIQRLQNSRTLQKAPKAVRETFHSWVEQGFVKEWEGPADQVLVSPLTLATKNFEVRRAFQALGVVDESEQHALLEDLDSFKARVKASGDESLRFKLRLCTDMSHTINTVTPPLPYRQENVVQAGQLLVDSAHEAGHPRPGRTEEAAQQLPNGSYGCTLDLKDMYHQLPISQEVLRFYGVAMDGVIYVHTTAQYGESDGSFYANAMVGVVIWIAKQRGILCIGYTDDVLVVGRTKEECLHHRNVVIQLFQAIGWKMAWDKITEPSQRVVFLGAILDSRDLSISLDQIRLQLELEEVVSFLNKGYAIKAQVQKLNGRLEYLSSAMAEGRAYVSRLHAATAWARYPTTKIYFPSGSGLEEDLRWWKQHLEKALAGGEAWSRFFRRLPIKVLRSFSDASGSTGFAITCGGSLIQGRWTQPLLEQKGRVVDIESQELLPLRLALRHLPDKELRDTVLIFSTDNAATALAVNKGSSTAPVLGQLLKEVYSLSALRNCLVIADHVPRAHNTFNDALSKGWPYERAIQEGLQIFI